MPGLFEVGAEITGSGRTGLALWLVPVVRRGQGLIRSVLDCPVLFRDQHVRQSEFAAEGALAAWQQCTVTLVEECSAVLGWPVVR